MKKQLFGYAISHKRGW